MKGTPLRETDRTSIKETMNMLEIIEKLKMTQILIPRFTINRERSHCAAWRSNASTTASAKVASISSLRSNSRFQFPDHLKAAMSIGLNFVELQDYADACRRLRDNDASLTALKFVELCFGSSLQV